MPNQPLDRNKIIDFILDLFARRGAEEYMGENEFEANPFHRSAIKTRLYDDKVAGLDIKPVSSYRNKLESLLVYKHGL